jgi:hypothetical protein
MNDPNPDPVTPKGTVHGSDDFAAEHGRPTYADEPSTEGPDESVPSGRGGDGGMDVERRSWWRRLWPWRRMGA